jgi:hypothetical protein
LHQCYYVVLTYNFFYYYYYHEVRSRQEEKDKIVQAKIEKDLLTYNSNLISLKELKQDKPDESTWKVDELKVALRVVKKTGDRANPQNKAGLQALWNEYRPRVASELQVHHESEAPLAANEVEPVVNDMVHIDLESVHNNEGHNEEGRTVM